MSVKFTPQNHTIFAPGSQLDSSLTIDDHTKKLFEDFPHGIPCRSQYLPGHIRRMNQVKGRRNEIMLGMCKVPCEELGQEYDEVKDPGALPTRKLTFATSEQLLIIRCPGIPQRGIPITWQVGAKQLIPNIIHPTNQERVQVNARDQLVFNGIKYSDTNLYSCWQRHRLLGTVKLSVLPGGTTYTSRYAVLGAMVIAAGVLLRYADRTLHNTQRRLGVT